MATLNNPKAATNRKLEGVGLLHEGTTKEEEMLEVLDVGSLSFFST